MIPPSLCSALICALHIWTINAVDCGDQLTEVNGRCCVFCPPGQYMKEFCSEGNQTICSPCEEGSYMNHHNFFDRCEKCLSCQQEYAEKCTPTTNAKCSCLDGFLCSNNVCSKCVENKCVTGETVKRTETPLGKLLTEYSYQCESLCPDDAYFDVKEGVCKKRTQCGIFGFAKRFPGNKTHNTICDGGEKHGNGGGFVHVILGIGFVLLSLTLLVLLSYACIKNLMKRKPHDHPIDVVAVPNNASDFHLSKEESGLQLILQDVSKNSCDSLGELHLDKISII